MKRLEELGISPAPWKVDDRELGCDNEIWCEYISDKIVKGEKRTKVVAKCNAHFDTYKPDARLIAAAPKLYEEQYHDCVSLRTIVTKLDEGAEILNLRDILAEMADRMEAGLAEAAGEKVDDGK